MRNAKWLHSPLPALAWLLLVAIQAQQPPRFRGRVALVPVDVRVVDRDGNPVTDLTRDDFTVFEDDSRQTIDHFEMIDHGRAGETDPAAGSPGAAAGSAGTQRNVVFVLGRGRLQGPSKGFDGLLQFIRQRTLPADRLGIVAYDRISELTVDRAPVLRLIERYCEHHEAIEATLDHWFRDLTLNYGDIAPPPGTQARIDGTLRIRTPVPGSDGSGSRCAGLV